MVNSQGFPFIHETYLATVEAQRAAPHNDVSHNQIIINNIRIYLLCYLSFYPVALGNYIFRVIREIRA